MANQKTINLGQQIYDADNSTQPRTVVDVIREDGQIKLVLSDDSKFIVSGLAGQKLDDWLGD